MLSPASLVKRAGLFSAINPYLIMILDRPNDLLAPLSIADPAARTSATAFAPAGVGNVAVGFDVLGHPLAAVGDHITIRRVERPGVEIEEITGLDVRIPLDPERNTATAGLIALIREKDLPFGMAVRIDKAIPLGSGMGGSAASAVGALVAANALLDEPLTPLQLLRYALVGETVASGSAHGDNLAPGLFGGLTLVRSMEPPDVVRIPVPEEVRCVLVYPHLRLDTRDARSILPTQVPRQTAVEHGGNLAAFVMGCATGDLELIRRSFIDLLAEPHRATLVPGFRAVQSAAIEAGALGCSLSGAGPSVFAWCADDAAACEVRTAMCDGFERTGVQTMSWISPVNAPGARLVEVA
jgi:homoserine kinase